MESAIIGRLAKRVDVPLVVQAIEDNGFAVIPDYVSRQDIAQAQRAIEKAVRSNNNESVAVLGMHDFSDTFLHGLEHDPDFVQLCRDICRSALGTSATDAKLVPSLRCLSGASGQTHSMIFHYDTFVLTVILPIIIPTEGRAGRLVMVPNKRPIRANYVKNLLDKVLLDNSIAQRRFHRLHARGDPRLVYVDMQPGNAYIFWGYRSVHTNEACDPDKIRSTAIFHFVDPHENSRMKRMLGR